MPYVIIALLIIGGIVAFIAEKKRKEKENLKKFPPGTGTQVTKTIKVQSKLAYLQIGGHYLMEHLGEDYIFFRLVKQSFTGTNYITVTTTVEYWTKEVAR